MNYWKRFKNDIQKYMDYAIYAARAELKSEVAGSYLNWVWWVLEPLCLMFIYAFIFGFMFNAREKYFTAFIFVGLACWTFFNKCLKNSVKMVKKQQAILSKVYVPKFIFLITKMMVNGFEMLISFLIVIGLMFFYRIPLSWNILFVPLILLCMFLLVFGCMCILLHFGVYVEDLANVVNIALRLLFYMTGIMFNIEHRIGASHPELAFMLGKCNPMAYLINALRDCVLYSTTPDLTILFIWYIISILLCIFGMRIIYKNENSYIKVS